MINGKLKFFTYLSDGYNILHPVSGEKEEKEEFEFEFFSLFKDEEVRNIVRTRIKTYNIVLWETNIIHGKSNPPVVFPQSLTYVPLSLF